MTFDLLYRGSVKNVWENKLIPNSLWFEFSDRYSVFDWGEMPDLLSHKGEALALIGAYFFEDMGNPKSWQESSFKTFLSAALEKVPAHRKKPMMDLSLGFEKTVVPHHFEGLYKDFHDAKASSFGRILKVQKIGVHRPVRLDPPSGTTDPNAFWDYSFYQKPSSSSFLVPLEVIFRFGLPAGSSLASRLAQENSLGYLKDLGLSEVPTTGESFEFPVIEFSTKLEDKDRFLSYAKAQEMAGLSDTEFQKLVNLMSLLALRLKYIWDQKDIELWDGKLEFAINPHREFFVVDSVGPDELRLLKDGVQLSKEFLRHIYYPTSWYTDLQKTKKTYGPEWRDHCPSSPDKLPPMVREKAQELYLTLAQVLYAPTVVFSKAPTLKDLVRKLKALSAPESVQEVPKNLKVLLLGGGGREHALAQNILKSEYLETLWAAPGNPGMYLDNPSKLKVTGITDTDIEALKVLVVEEQIDLVVVGPEKPVALGVTEALEALGARVFGPSQRAGELETSKIFCKRILEAAGVPTARYHVCQNYAEAQTFFQQKELSAHWSGYVVKVDGLAQGKGVIVCDTENEALKAAHDLLVDADYPVKAEKILIEEKLSGREVSAFAFCSGESFEILGLACDYKRLRDGDLGPNTGGMGAYSPVPWIEESFSDFEKTLADEVFGPTLKFMQDRRTPFKGVLFAGIMVQPDKKTFSVLEYNVRLGDPEAQVLIPLSQLDLLPIFWEYGATNFQKHSALNKTLKKRSGVHVVLCADGYPGTEGRSVQTGMTVKAPSTIPKDILLTYAGVKQQGRELVSSSGRVCGVTAIADTLADARSKAYAFVSQIQFQGMHFRKDVAQYTEGTKA